MRRAPRLLLPLVPLFLAALVLAEDVARPLVFFRKPDKRTEKTIENELIKGNGLGAGTSAARAEARHHLEVYDAWAVPYLAAALSGRKKDGSHIVRLNAVATLGRILDPRALPSIREAAADDKDRWVRRGAFLVLGEFADATDHALLSGVLDLRPEKNRDPAAALALGKLRGSPAAADALLAQLANPPGDQHLLAGLLLGASVRSPKAPVEAFLPHKERLVQYVAAACLQIRPLDPGRIDPLLRQIERGRWSDVQEMQFYALATMPNRNQKIRDFLVDCASKTEHKPGARVAALIGLAYEQGREDLYDKLAGLYRRVSKRNDPVTCATMFALVQTGDARAIDALLAVTQRGSPLLRFYATGSLFHLIAFGEGKHPRETEIADAIARQRTHTEDAALLKLLDLVGRWQRPGEGVGDRRQLARDGLKEIGDPKRLHLFDWSREDRAWEIVNSMVPRILELDHGKADIDSIGPATGVKPGTSRGKEEGATEEELDLLSFLDEKPYFAPGDLG